jgi:hypothetical protein
LSAISSVPLFVKLIFTSVSDGTVTVPLFVNVPPWNSTAVQEKAPPLVILDDCKESSGHVKVTPPWTVKEADSKSSDGTVRLDPVANVKDPDSIRGALATLTTVPSTSTTLAWFRTVRLSNASTPDSGVAAPAVPPLSITRSP